MRAINPQLLIVGAGPTGLAMAAEAARCSLSFRIIDRASHPARWSQAFSLQARTLEQFERYGIADRLVSMGRKLRFARVYSEGRRVMHASLDGIPSRHAYLLAVPQSTTEELLTRVVTRSGYIEREVALESFVDEGDTVVSQLRHADGRVEEVSTRWLLGCDGAHSTVRAVLDVPLQVTAPPQTFLLADVHASGGDAPGDEVVVHLHQGTTLLMARLDADTLRLQIVRDDVDSEQLTLNIFARTVKDVGLLDLSLSDPIWLSAYRVSQGKAQSFQEGRVILAGEAACIYSPVSGQSLNSGIQDAANLIWKIAAVENGFHPRALVDTYATEREPVAAALVELTTLARSASTTRGFLLRAWRETDTLMSPLVSGLRTMEDRIRMAISGIGINYRQSPIVRDVGGLGTLLAGDRMADVTLVGGRRLFTDLADPRSVLVCGRGTETGVPALPPWIRTARIAAPDDEACADTLCLVRPDGYIACIAHTWNDMEAFTRRAQSVML